MVIFVFHLYKQRYLNLNQGDLDSDFIITVKNLSTDIFCVDENWNSKKIESKHRL